MLNPDEDTEWNDILRQKGILPPKKVEVVNDPSPSPPDPETLLNKMTLDELNDKVDLAEDEGLMDEEDAKFLEEYRRKRIALMHENASRAKYGQVRAVTKSDWKSEVSESGDVYVVIHVAERGHPLCNTIDSHLILLARKFTAVKFLRGESSLCIPDYPECNLPSLLIYYGGELKHQLIGPQAVGGKSVTVKGLEWRLAQLGVLKTKLTEDPAKRIQVSTISGRTVNRIGQCYTDSDNSDSDE
ncbi:Viral IAP-associated factor [Paragonimus heterotremus]|uniref:Viral IAP-associated factor n=1 Tax=Paragonimus heterotremus TaxID=100268 RepID=A0A8J4SQ49_9TREM|nr:Viral IAP-associated factor [Paragonimus heterotremus]